MPDRDKPLPDLPPEGMPKRRFEGTAPDRSTPNRSAKRRQPLAELINAGNRGQTAPQGAVRRAAPDAAMVVTTLLAIQSRNLKKLFNGESFDEIVRWLGAHPEHAGELAREAEGSGRLRSMTTALKSATKLLETPEALTLQQRRGAIALDAFLADDDVRKNLVQLGNAPTHDRIAFPEARQQLLMAKALFSAMLADQSTPERPPDEAIRG